MSNVKQDNVSVIDAAINKAKARKATKSGDKSEGSKEPKVPGTKRPRLSDEEKASRQANRDAERATKKASRDEARQAKRAMRDANKAPAHIAKVAKAFAKLPVLNETAQVAFGDITSNFSRDQVAAIAAHLNHFNRAKATERALSQKLEQGMSVRIVGGDSRFIGKVGTVSKAQRIRCYVEVEGAKKPVYLFTSDVEVMNAAQATGT